MFKEKNSLMKLLEPILAKEIWGYYVLWLNTWHYPRVEESRVRATNVNDNCWSYSEQVTEYQKAVSSSKTLSSNRLRNYQNQSLSFCRRGNWNFNCLRLWPENIQGGSRNVTRTQARGPPITMSHPNQTLGRWKRRGEHIWLSITPETETHNPIRVMPRQPVLPFTRGNKINKYMSIKKDAARSCKS